MEEESLLSRAKDPKNKKILLIILTILALIIITIIVVVIAVNTTGSAKPNYEKYHKEFLGIVNAAKIGELIYSYSLYPHIAASQGDYDTVVMTLDCLKNWNIKSLNMTFPVLLPYPSRRNLTVVYPFQYTAELKEECILEDPPSCLPNGVPTFNGYSGSGNVTGELVYVNYGRKEDFEALNGTVDFNGKIVIVRYGKNFRGNKPVNAEKYGAIGCIIFIDPAETGYLRGPVYPEGPWSTAHTVQRGTLKISDGDPTTMGWPSEPDGARYTVEQIRSDASTMYGIPLVNIPVIPISYGDATNILKNFTGFPLPNPDWTTGLNLTSVGPSIQVVLDILMNETVEDIWNVHGIIEGQIEPDRVVLFGSHRDAWTMGASDPISGHSTSMEILRGFSELVKRGWKPRRTIIFCSWDAEEQGLEGSTEFLEKTINQLRDRAIIYLNLDIAVDGPGLLELDGVPSLNKLVNEAALLAEIKGTGKTIADIWEEKKISPAVGGSDDAPFLMRFGIPVLKAEISGDSSRYEAVYHSNYDSYYWTTHFGDTNFTYHAAMAQFYGYIILRIADDSVLPFDYTDYATDIHDRLQIIKSQFSGLQLDWSSLENAVLSFNQSAISINEEITSYKNWEKSINREQSLSQKALQLRSINDRLMNVDKAFISDQFLMTGSQWYRHIIYSLSDDDSYSSDLFPALINQLSAGNSSQAQFLIKRFASQFQGASHTLSSQTLS